jgi:acetyl esterase/lipase
MAYAFDPELAPYVELLPTREAGDIEATRAFVAEITRASLARADVSGLRIEDRVVPGTAGAPDVCVRIFLPESANRPCGGVLYIHGGGFTVGSIDMEQAQAAQLAREVGVTVVSVEYRLAPEHPFPAALDDCYAALRWLYAQAATLDVEPSRIAVVGNSAGGGLAAGLALYARDHGGPPLCFQYLGIPELDDRLETWSMRTFVDTPMWTRAAAARSWSMYLGAHDGDVSPYAAPARAVELAGLPPAYISTMEFDPLRDEGILYGLALLRAGVSVELHSFPGTFHGCRSYPTAITARDADEMVVVLRRALSAPAD